MTATAYAIDNSTRAPHAPVGMVAGDTLTIDGARWQVRAAEYGYSPAGLPNVTLTLWRDFADAVTIRTLYVR